MKRYYSGPMTPGDPRHGTDRGYNAGCREECCRRGHSRAREGNRLRPKPMVSSVGARRRVQALARLGWSMAEVSRRLGGERSYLHKILGNDRIHPDTHAAIAELYEQLCMTWATGPAAGRTAEAARRAGYAPPLAWDDRAIDEPSARPAGRGMAYRAGYDEVAVERFMAGDYRLRTTPEERVEIVRRWRKTERTLNDLARLTGWKVERYHHPGDHSAAS